MEQPQLFETEDQYGNDIIQDPKLEKRKLTTKEAMIDPKTLAICFVACLVFVTSLWID